MLTCVQKLDHRKCFFFFHHLTLKTFQQASKHFELILLTLNQLLLSLISNYRHTKAALCSTISTIPLHFAHVTCSILCYTTAWLNYADFAYDMLFTATQQKASEESITFVCVSLLHKYSQRLSVTKTFSKLVPSNLPNQISSKTYTLLCRVAHA